MACGNLDATVLISEPPEIEFDDGLFIVTYRMGGVILRQCFRPNTFLKGIEKARRMADAFHAERDNVVQLRAAEH